jgi:transmembrane carrier protein
MSRMYNQTGNLYKGVFDCLYKTVTTEGVLAIYKGFFAHLARILPHTVRVYPATTAVTFGETDIFSGLNTDSR